MKKILLIALTALFAAMPLARADGRSDYVKQIENCEAIIREFMADKNHAIPDTVLREARAIVITSQFEAGLIFGMKGGYGVIMVKRGDGTWSIPVLIRAGEASVGLQVGGKSIETVYIITDDATPKVLFTKRLNVGADAKAVAGPKYAEAESVSKEILDVPVLVYVKNKGLMAGATVKAGYMSRNDDANRKFYNTEYTMPELLYGNFVPPPPEVQPLMAFIKQIVPEAEAPAQAAE
ncbi:lipid-binding SYLF domain-containing protein [Ereboglobus sp. PH5-5]|uniref:lipid-binding SYLF domain-containing protein n=1 Tax=Ereboglobus sp. PH5-5 TaxID=2940529 RepID=UPI00240585CF|nr:lipid-binding SYLF domain-containing protein [Ereboglobus sp. PH5-5]MDF9834133.1 lipid-binding SYLF domain-containing protein [Ereboglobus sp. PH5-5]